MSKRNSFPPSSSPDLFRRSRSGKHSANLSEMAGHRRAQRRRSTERLCPAMTSAGLQHAEPELEPREQIIEGRRLLCTKFQFWRACERKSCRRARGCVGDPLACFATCWPFVPEDTKDALRERILQAAAAT